MDVRRQSSWCCYPTKSIEIYVIENTEVLSDATRRKHNNRLVGGTSLNVDPNI